MIKDYETRHIFMAIAIGVLFLSPIFLLLFPSLISNSIHFTPGTLFVFVPGVGYLYYFFALLFLFCAFFTLFLFDIQKKSILFCLLFLLLSSFTFVTASQSYIAFADHSVSFRKNLWNDNHIYAWEEVDQVLFAQESYEYEFSFADGNTWRISETSKFREIRSDVLRMVRLSGGEYDVVSSF